VTDQPDDETLYPGQELEHQIEDSWARFAAAHVESAAPSQTDDHDEDDEALSTLAEVERIAPLEREADVGTGQALFAVVEASPAAAVEEDEPPSTAVPISVWTLLFNPKAVAQQRIDDLGRAIERSPDAPSNYVLRGELLLKLRRYADAEMDFRRALDLAAAQVESQDWGVVAQVAQDRALAGLKQSLSRRSTL
jgi:tetratricopeptide (TPR) repeat protein